jgi:hypothetical protein
MTRLAMAVGLAVALTFGAGAYVSAQDAAPILPAPRMSDGHPDFNGVFQASRRRGKEWDAETPGEELGVAAPRPRAGGPPPRDPIPYQDWARAKAQEYLNRRSIDDPAASCLPVASPRTTPTGLFPVQFVQTPNQVVILYEYFWLFRVIPTDGRPHPEDASPSWMGDSVGHWDGDTLVVDVNNFKEGGWIGAGIFTSDQLHLVERYTRVDRDQLNYEVTIEDPKVFTKPWKMNATLMQREGTRLREYACMENNVDLERYQQFLKNPSLFERKPPK